MGVFVGVMSDGEWACKRGHQRTPIARGPGGRIFCRAYPSQASFRSSCGQSESSFDVRGSSARHRPAMVGTNSSEDDAAEAMEASEPPVQLMDLPYDLLFSMLTHSSLGPREICRLEQVSHATRALLTDDGCWKRVFLRERRPPALGDPSSWKAELARREEWSRSWRQRGGSDPADEMSKAESVVARCIAPAHLSLLRACGRCTGARSARACRPPCCT